MIGLSGLEAIILWQNIDKSLEVNLPVPSVAHLTFTDKHFYRRFLAIFPPPG